MGEQGWDVKVVIPMRTPPAMNFRRWSRMTFDMIPVGGFGGQKDRL